jgi:hypothetical protein
VPIVVLYGASANEQLRGFGIYYAIVLVPFLVLSAAGGVSWLVDRVNMNKDKARVLAAGLIVIGSLVPNVSNAGYSLRPWRPEVGTLSGVLSQLNGERAVLVQGGLYPHAGYDSRVQLLTKESLADARYAGAAIVLAPAMSAYPMDAPELNALVQRPVILSTATGLVVIRNPFSRRP